MNDAAEVTEAPVKNWAESESVRARIKTEILPLLNQIRNDRAGLNAAWASYHRTWSMEHEEQGYTGRSNLYLPAANKGIESQVSQVVSATFPGDDFFDIDATKQEFAVMAQDVKALEKERVRCANVRGYAEAFYRQLFIKGNSPARVHWGSRKFMGQRREKKVTSEEELLLGPGRKEYTAFEGPLFTPIPAENFYVWPTNVTSLADAIIKFEDLATTKWHLIARAREKTYLMEQVKEIKGEQRYSNTELADQDTLAGQQLTTESTKNVAGNIPGLVGVDITHVYMPFDPEAADYEAEDNPQLMLITVTAGGQVLRCIENPNPSGEDPYMMARLGTLVGRAYGTGQAERMKPLQQLLNDQTNQSMDCATFNLNPITITNPDAIHGILPELEPGVQLLVNDINAALKFDRPPSDMLQNGAMLMQQTMGWLQDFGGAPAVLQGSSPPGRAWRSATGIGTAQKNATLPLQEIVRLCEADVWEPMLNRFWALDQRMAGQDVRVELGGESIKNIDPKSLYGEYKWRWLASTQAANQQVRGSQIQSFLQVLLSPAMGQLAQMNGFKINPKPLLERLYRDVLGFRDTEKVLIDVQPGGAPGQPGMPGQQGQLPPGIDPNGGVPQEALDGGVPEAVNPGEFAANRMEANDIAGAFGGDNGGGMDFGGLDG